MTRLHEATEQAYTLICDACTSKFGGEVTFEWTYAVKSGAAKKRELDRWQTAHQYCEGKPVEYSLGQVDSALIEKILAEYPDKDWNFIREEYAKRKVDTMKAAEYAGT